MQNHIEGISVQGDLRWRAWDGALIDLWSVSCTPDARGEYISQAPRLVVILDQQGEGSMHVALSPECMACPARPAFDTMCYVPAGVRVWSRVEDMRALKHLDIHLDLDSLTRRFGRGMDREAIETPRLGFRDARLSGLARLIAAECAGPETTDSDLYGDSLIAALVAALWRAGLKAPERQRGRLSPSQLRRAVDFIEENCARNVRLQELAEITGLSSSYFCAAFRASTGVPPHRWQMRIRIDKAKAMIERPAAILADVAVAVGFADQAHLTRVFRQIEGTTPAAWMKMRGTA